MTEIYYHPALRQQWPTIQLWHHYISGSSYRAVEPGDISLPCTAQQAFDAVGRTSWPLATSSLSPVVNYHGSLVAT